MDVVKLKQLLKLEEGPKLDFKAEMHLSTESEKKELTKDVIAIANSRGGRGHIIYGIEDKTKKIIGVEPGDFTEEQIQQIIYNRSDPPVPVSVEFIRLEDRLVATITIFKSSHRPHQMLQGGAFYIRRGSTTDVARRSEISGMFQESGLMTYETVIVKNAGMQDMDTESVNSYLSSIGASEGKITEVLMEALGFVGESDQGTSLSPTIGGLLLFGRNPWKFLPQVYIKVINSENVQFFYGSILKMLNDVMNYVKSQIVQEGYPFDALEETLANAMVHRDYLDLRGVVVCISDRAIEVSNPGALMPGNSIYHSEKEINPNRRNGWLYQRLLTVDPKMRYMRLGTGMSRIRSAFRDIGNVKFINIGSQNLFKVILPLRSDKINKSDPESDLNTLVN